MPMPIPLLILYQIVLNAASLTSNVLM